jgi:hypothetical protein
MLVRMSGLIRRVFLFPKAGRLRRPLLVLLAFTYLFVWFAQTISCADEVLDDIPFATALDATDGPDRDGGAQAPVVVKHCPMCAPLVVPVPASVLVPESDASRLAFVPPIFRLEDHRHLDPPPPKWRT